MRNVTCSSPVQNKLSLIGNPDNVVLHGVGEKASLKRYFSVKSTFAFYQNRLQKMLQKILQKILQRLEDFGLDWSKRDNNCRYK